MMKVLTWNVRGLGKPKKRTVKSMIIAQKSDLVFIQETKWPKIDRCALSILILGRL